ncbi:MAG: lamin tail domain-containing protein [Spirochaetota bacterium]|nr:lamin tail domain-containing protein [Spirochaetota bacterium]
MIILYLLIYILFSCGYPERYVEGIKEEKQYSGIEIFLPSRILYVSDRATASLLILLPSGEKIISYNADVSWSSSNSEIISISDSGIITALSRGSVDINAAMDDYDTSEEIIVEEFSKILLSEVFYDPPSPESEREFIEIYNGHNYACDISGFVIIDGKEDSTPFTFPLDSLIPSNSFIVIAKSYDGFYNYFELYPDYSGFTFPLNNDGETIYLLRPDNHINDAMCFEGGVGDICYMDDWCIYNEEPSASEGNSVQRINFNINSTCTDWESGEPTPGSN